jgi:hypothetical protein
MSLGKTRRQLAKAQRDIDALTPRGSFGILTSRTTAGVTRRPLNGSSISNQTTNKSGGGNRWA